MKKNANFAPAKCSKMVCTDNHKVVPLPFPHIAEHKAKTVGGCIYNHTTLPLFYYVAENKTNTEYGYEFSNGFSSTATKSLTPDFCVNLHVAGGIAATGQNGGVIDWVQTGLDVVGLVPVVGEFADGLNALIYLGRGQYLNAGLSGAAMIPFAGWAATGGKLGAKSLTGTKNALTTAKSKIGLGATETLPKGQGKFGSPQRGDPQRGYRLDPAHPNAPPGSVESFPHINFWDYTQGKRGSGGVSGAIPIF